MRSADGFLDRLASRLQGVTDPVVAVTEGVAFAVEQLAPDTQVEFVLSQRRPNGHQITVMSDTTLAFGRSMLHRFEIDWEHYGFDEAGLDELNEFCLRVLHSFLADPGLPPRTGEDLRRYLTRWIGPAIAYPQVLRAMDALRLPSPPACVGGLPGPPDPPGSFRSITDGRWLIRCPASAILNERTLTTTLGANVVGMGQIALNSAPIFGGAMLAVAAGQLRGPDYRGTIQQDMELLDRLPPEATRRRADLRRTIDDRIDDLIEGADRSRALRKAALTYRGNWRDVVLLLCALLFTVIWWDVSHSRSNWLPMFVVLILLSILAAVYTFRGMMRSVLALVHRQGAGGGPNRLPGRDATD
jgi:hypothetical protein